eukprot:366227-Chlamydomonas_euryale.AAC.18
MSPAPASPESSSPPPTPSRWLRAPALARPCTGPGELPGVAWLRAVRWRDSCGTRGCMSVLLLVEHEAVKAMHVVRYRGLVCGCIQHTPRVAKTSAAAAAMCAGAGAQELANHISSQPLALDIFGRVSQHASR